MSRGIQRCLSGNGVVIVQESPRCLRPSRSKTKVSFPLSVSVQDPILPLDAKAVLDMIQKAKVLAKTEPLQCEDDKSLGARDSPLSACCHADLEKSCVLACHTCSGLDDLTLFPDKVIENIVTANMEAKKFLRMLRSPSRCGYLDEASQFHAFVERFIVLTDICNPAVHAAKSKMQNDSSQVIENLLDYRAPSRAAVNSAPAVLASRAKSISLEESVIVGLWRETRLLCETLGCRPPQPFPARQSDVSKSSNWDQSLQIVERALRECNRACMALGIGVEDAGLAWSPSDDMGACRAKLEQALNDRRSLLLVNKKLLHKQEQKVSHKLLDEETAEYISKLERCIAALSLKCNLPNPFFAHAEVSESGYV